MDGPAKTFSYYTENELKRTEPDPYDLHTEFPVISRFAAK